VKEILQRLNTSRLAAYRACSRDILEHAGKEESVSAGGYGYRQILELVQNGADAILEAEQKGHDLEHARIEVRLTDTHLYVANTGAPLSEQGIEALLSSDLSPKRGNEIGRFGLGFKSLLRLGGLIDIFTRSAGNIRFDPAKCRSELREAFGVSVAPGLRLAWSLDESSRHADSQFNTLAWAETVVRAEVCTPSLREHLELEIRKFPSEFLLFLDRPVELSLDAGSSSAIVLRVENQGDVKVLHVGEEQVRWRVFSRQVEVGDRDSVVDATSIHARKSVPLAWATPIDAKREESGRFWAFFPTHTPTYLPGILNAPWKLNSDRNSLVRGEWNSILMREAAKMVVEHMPELSSPDDPGRTLDAFPRQPERLDDDAVPMVNAIWAALSDAQVIPDADGSLRRARELLRPPRDDKSLIERWQTIASAKILARFVHSTCLDRLRSSRLNALAEKLKLTQIGLGEFAPLARCVPKQWFELIASTDPKQSLEVLRLAELYQDACSGHDWTSTVASLLVIPTSEGDLVSCNDVVFVPEGTSPPAGRKSVATNLVNLVEAKRILTDTFGVGELDEATWIAGLEESLTPVYFIGEWSAFWNNLRAAPRLISRRFAEKNRSRIYVRSRSGSWKPPFEVLLPGEIVHAAETGTNTLVLVHSDHSQDTDLLAVLGVSDCPAVAQAKRTFGELHEWLSFWRSHYFRNHDSRPRSDYLSPLELTLPLATVFLPLLSGHANARLTAKLLPLLSSCPSTCVFGHETMERYPKIEVPHPLPWLLLRYGEIFIGDDTVPLRAHAPRAEVIHNALSLAGVCAPSLSQEVLSRLSGTTQPACPANTQDIQRLWTVCIKAAAIPSHLSDDSLSALWSAVAADNMVPTSIPTPKGAVPLTSVLVTSSPDLAHRARTTERIVVTLGEKALQLWQSRGARPLADLLKPEWDALAGPDLLVVDVIPELASVLKPAASRDARCQSVNGLRLAVADQRDSLACLIWDDRLLIDLSQIRALPLIRRFQVLLSELALTSWLELPLEAALRVIADSSVQTKRTAVSSESSVPARLLKAVDGRPAPLLAALGGIATQKFIADCTPLKLAELVLSHHGPATLLVIRGALEEAGLQPPARWNTAEARAFVTALGFPEAFAEAAAARRDPEEIITGPISLPPLHDFQTEVLDSIRTLLVSGMARRRAVVSLPTGGGKTRVTVEAAVKLVLAPVSRQRSVIWIAQSDELCEQAVQAFRQVWLNVGAQRTDLRIVRLWGGNPNPAQQDPGKPQVIVASIQTLNARMGSSSLEWLQQPGMVVVDECHHAITPSYTDLLRWLDAEAQGSGSTAKNEPPILGLSATPFRMDDDESRRLAARFGNLWFPSDQAGLHARLLTQGVLAKVDNEPLESGTGLTEEESRLLEIHGTRSEGIDFERAIEALNQRLAGVEERNRRIVECVQQSPQHSILLFANSVPHASELSVRLNLLGIPAAAVSGETPRTTRRYFLERFQRGELRVLCNHSVLTTGFDAPRTDMILIARQVFSPVRYMQIVGRGLRGEKNGGTPRCRIVTVIDNLGRFQGRHPYHYCARYFQSMNSDTQESVSA